MRMTRTIRLLSSVAVVAAAVLTSAQEAQIPPSTQPPVTFRAEVNYVEVDARVLDDQGAFVPGLTGAEFQVFEDGKPQKVSAFSLVNIPVERQQRPLFAAAPIEPDVQNNITGYDGRIPLHELMIMNDEIKKTIQNKERSSAILEVALATGMRTLRQDGIQKVLAGHTDLKQVHAACVR